MKIVGDELSILASSRHGSDDFDLLGRSAYNRYYYSAYLITRQTVGQMRSDWKRISHAGLPTLLDSALINVVKSHLERQRRTNLITQGQYSRLLSDFRNTANELAQLLKLAYNIRTLADYEPEIKISYINHVISLQSCNITTAKEWTAKTDKLCGRLLRLWKEIGLG